MEKARSFAQWKRTPKLAGRLQFHGTNEENSAVPFHENYFTGCYRSRQIYPLHSLESKPVTSSFVWNAFGYADGIPLMKNSFLTIRRLQILTSQLEGQSLYEIVCLVVFNQRNRYADEFSAKSILAGSGSLICGSATQRLLCVPHLNRNRIHRVYDQCLPKRQFFYK